MKKTDYHCHFSGSLSPGFLLGHNLSRLEFQPHFSDDWESNTDLFFETYAKIQKATKIKGGNKHRDLYLLGCYDICSSYISESVDEFHLRVGPKLDIKETIRRLEDSIVGFEKAERENGKQVVGKLMLTLIHDEFGHFTNVNSTTLGELLEYLRHNSDLSKRVVGFDFSGPEKNFDSTDLFGLLNMIIDFNKVNTPKYEVAVHAGEYVDRDNIFSRFNYLEKLTNSGVDRLSHGTLLWVDSQLIDSEQSINISARQKDILKIIAKRKIHLEICPTANMTLSPLKTQTNIPLSMLDDLGVIYSINTDNKTIFDTSLKKEWGYFPSNTHNPFETAVNGSKTTNLSPKSSRS